MSSSQLASALRPFYFVVHPDLFCGHPEMRKVNEQSLKTLNGYLDTLYRQNRIQNATAIQNIQVKFYVRDRKKVGDKRFTPISINLGGETHPGAVIAHILESVQLDSTHLGVQKVKGHTSHMRVTFDDDKIRQFWKTHSTQESGDGMTLSNALEKHTASCSRLQQTSDNVRQHLNTEVAQLRKRVPNIANITCNTIWRVEFARGALRAFDQLLHSFPALAGALTRMNNINIRFDSGSSHLCTDGTLQLCACDPPEYWMRVIQAAPSTRALLGHIKPLQIKIANALGGVTLVSEPRVSIAEYHRWLATLCTQLVLEHSHLHNHVQYRGVHVKVHSTSAGLFLTKEGEIIVPCNASIEQICTFLKEFSPVARSRLNEQTKLLNEISGACDLLKKKFKLNNITYETGLDLMDVLECFDELDGIHDEDLIDKLETVKSVHIANNNFGVTAHGQFILPLKFYDS